MFIKFSCDMKYYLANKSEIDVDLGRQVDWNSFDPNDAMAVKKLEQELFYENMCKIFGRESDDDDRIEVDVKSEQLYEKSFMLSDFSIYAFDGNELHAIANRGDYYLLFHFDFS